MSYDFDMFYYIDLYKKWWKRIAFVMAISMFLVMCISKSKPVVYVSTTSLLLTGDVDSGDSLGKFLGLSVGRSSNTVIISILQSRRMADDIRRQFNLTEKPKFWYGIDIREIEGGLAVNVKGPDPILTKDIANFATKDLDKINTELDLTAKKPMVKVLDEAIEGRPESRQILRKVGIAGIMVFLLMSLLAFFSDYIRKLKRQIRR